MQRIVPRHRWLVGSLLAALVAATGATASAAPADPVDVVVRGSDSTDVARLVASHGGEVVSELTYLGGVTATIGSDDLDVLRARADVQVTLDEPLELASLDLATTGPDTVADQPQLADLSLPDHWSPAAGTGVGVALLDTGVADVPELEDRVLRGPDYSGDGDGLDHHGHGTFMAGLIAGDGRASDEDDPRFGVAPGAHIVSVKLAGRDGVTSLAHVLDAIGWVIAHQDDHAIRVLNLSLGAPTKRSPRADPLSAAVEAAWASGITVVTASGNDGARSVTSPGRDPWVITVGASDRSTGVATVPDWSGSGKVAGESKPELLAPGVSTVSLRAPGSAVDEGNPQAHVDERYMRGSGTSMSAALVSGAVAVLAEVRPFATPDDLKGALASTGGAVSGEIGRAVDVAAADLAEPDPSWNQDHPIAFKGLGGRLRAGMPWAEDGPGVGETWARARWLDGEWQRARWLDDDWARARWLDDEWARARWLDDEWARARWLETDWQRARWLQASFARARWLDANFTRARWLETDWQRARWLSQDWSGEPALTAPATWQEPAPSAVGRRRK